MTLSQQMDMRVAFRSKFGILRASFSEWNIQDPSDEMTLDQIHDTYENYVRQIMISLNSNQYKTYLIGLFLAIEVCGIKFFGLDFRGYTMSQTKVMNRYNQLLIELGEKYYVQGNSTWPVEVKFIFMAGVNAIIFVVIKYLSKYLGGDGMSGVIQGIIDKFMNSENTLSSQQNVARDDVGVPVIPSSNNDMLGGIVGSLGSMLGNSNGSSGSGGFDIGSLISNLGSAFANKPTSNSTTNPVPNVSRLSFTD